jgi:hypothetical protein
VRKISQHLSDGYSFIIKGTHYKVYRLHQHSRLVQATGDKKTALIILNSEPLVGRIQNNKAS